MSEAIVARLPASRKSTRNWTGPLLALLPFRCSSARWLFAFPSHATEAEFRQVVDPAAQAEAAARAGSRPT